MKIPPVVTVLIIFLSIGELYSQIPNSFRIQTGIAIADQTLFGGPPAMPWWGITADKNGEVVHQADVARIGYLVNLSSEWIVTKRINMSLNLELVQKGALITYSIRDQLGQCCISAVHESKFLYVSLFPQISYRKEMYNFLPYINIGPRLDFQLMNEFADDWVYLHGYNEKISALIFGLSYGGGIKYQRVKYSYSFEIQHQPDFTKVYHDIVNRAILLKLGVSYKLESRTTNDWTGNISHECRIFVVP
ncbi:MAG: hypothetical protein IIA45_14940 [Bacteroidetes bacterium]|nr:hypothetical protein [Bacteroidota bacterium]